MKAISYAIGGFAIGAIGGAYFSIKVVSSVIATAVCQNFSDEKVEALTNAIKRVKTEDTIKGMEEAS